ncbi:MAG: Trm112 family protein [Candidatus Thioglobus sp.]|nr:Trm112 family protein [Candidatus Thioglobus sp.]
MIEPELLELLVCPKSHAPLEQVGDELICKSSGLAYPIQDGVPILLEQEAREID